MGRRSPFTGHLGFRYGTILYREQWLAGCAVEEKHESRLGDLRDGLKFVAVMINADEVGAGWEIMIPKIVAHGLEMPEAFARARVETNGTICEEIVSLAPSAIEIR